MFEAYLPLSTPSISDALDILGLKGAPSGIRHIGGTARVFGPAYTVRFQPVTSGTHAPAADYIDEVPKGSVIVLANGGRLDCTVWGGILTHCAKALGLQGTVIDGCCRDVETIRELAYPVYANGVHVQSGKNRALMTQQNGPVAIDGIRVDPGDIVCGDESGVVFVPHSRAEEIFQLASKIQEAENSILTYCKAGGSLKEARRKFNYNQFALSGEKSQS